MKSILAIARKLARTMLFIGATTWRSEPYKWASGMLMHIYNDNRMMLALYSHRIRVAHGFIEKIKILVGVRNLNYILGTSTSGIGPATTVAQLLKKKLLVNEGGKFYVYEENLIDKKVSEYNWFKRLSNYKAKDKDDFAIVTTCPLAIPYGVQYANKLKIQFAYVRKQKDHGKQQQVEGNLKPGTKVILMFTGKDEESVLNAHNTTKKILQDKGCTVLAIYGIDLHGKNYHRELDLHELKDANTVVIEDLFSTGGSSAYEVHQLRKAGAVCNWCISIFSYEFNVLKDQFSGESPIGDKGVYLSTPCGIDTLLPFSTLYSEMKRLDFFTEKIRVEMKAEIENFDVNYQKFLKEKNK